MPKALQKSGGSVASAARMLRVSRQSLYSRMLVEPAIREARDEINEATIDLVETELVKAALAGEPWAVRFFLSTQARHRGYGPPGGNGCVSYSTADTDSADMDARIAASTIDLYSLTPEELETLAQIAEKNERRVRDGDGCS